MNWNQAQQDYQHYLKIERGLADNSIKNYLFDIEKLVSFLEGNKLNENPVQIQKETVQQFVYEIAKRINPRSQARIISGLKSFFNYLIFEDYRTDNPMDLIESPKIGRKLPDTLSQTEIDELVNAIDLSKPEGERNRVFAEAFGRDPEFFEFYRSMAAYTAALQQNGTTLVLSPDSEFFRYFKDATGANPATPN